MENIKKTKQFLSDTYHKVFENEEEDKKKKEKENPPYILPYVFIFISIWIVLFGVIFPVISTISMIKNIVETNYLVYLSIVTIVCSVLLHGLLMAFLLGVNSLRESVFISSLIACITVFITFLSLTLDSFINGNLIKMYENSIGYFIIRNWYSIKYGIDLNKMFQYHPKFMKEHANRDLSFLLTLFEIKDTMELNSESIKNILNTKVGNDIFIFNNSDETAAAEYISKLKEMILYKYQIGNTFWFFFTSIFGVLVNLKFLLNI